MLELQRGRVCPAAWAAGLFVYVAVSLVFDTYLKLSNLQCKYNFNRNVVLLLIIDNIKTNGLMLPVGYKMHLEIN